MSDKTPVPVLIDGNRDAATHVILAHGAGASMDSPWLTRFSGLLAAAGLCVHRFEFAYMAARRHGVRRPPPRGETLTGEFVDVAKRVSAGLRKQQRLVIGGKSMGGRVASLIAGDLHAAGTVSGLVCLGYPFHPVGQPEKLRTAHLAALACPTLIVQGSRDPFGTREDVAGYDLSRTISIHWIENGDHDLKGAGRGVMEGVASVVAQFASGR
jgi:predicted alpha/beta-hydrolase family hydrolase